MINRFMNDALYRFRVIALLEGVSFLFLLFIAMPLKYSAEFPLFVKYGGWAHGVLFVGYVMLLFVLRETYQWNLKWTGLAFLAALLPFGTFILDRKMLQPLQKGRK